MTERGETRYARNGDVHLAFQAVGEGELDLLLVDTWVHHVEAVWEFGDYARFLRRLSAFGRLIHFDRRGTGLSDPVPTDELPDLETQVDDAVAVLDAAGSSAAAVIGLNDGTITAMKLAAAHPERCRSLVLFATAPAHALAGGMPLEEIDDVIAMMTEGLRAGNSGVELLARSRVDDRRFSEQLSRFQRSSLRPGVIGHYYRQTMTVDVRDALPLIAVPTLVLNRTDNPIVPAALSREAADLIPAARYVELPGTDHLAFSEDPDLVLDEIEEFVTGARTGADPDRMLTTMLFTDIVDSTAVASAIGDRRWRDVLDQHHAVMRAQLERFAGREIVTTGDGFFATFERPVSAVRCALAATTAMPALGVGIRAGVHTGEVEVRGSDLGGLAVHIAARVAGAAGDGEVFVSSTVRDLLAGSDVALEDAGEHVLKGVPDRWRLYRASVPSRSKGAP
ncbi:MAG: adenylate/guanylate cyclase domain-containing protein [Actinomycetota bacterium]